MASYTQTAVGTVFGNGGTVNTTQTVTGAGRISPTVGGWETVNNTRTITGAGKISPAVGDQHTVNRTFSYTGEGFTTPFDAEGVKVPTGNFRPVTVYLENVEGKPLTDAMLVQSAGLFPTAARVKTDSQGRAVATMWLLDAAYSEFSVISDSGREEVDYVWYQEHTKDGPAVERSQREATLQFRQVEPSTSRPLSVGFGASIGGS